MLLSKAQTKKKKRICTNASRQQRKIFICASSKATKTSYILFGRRHSAWNAKWRVRKINKVLFKKFSGMFCMLPTHYNNFSPNQFNYECHWTVLALALAIWVHTVALRTNTVHATAVCLSLCDTFQRQFNPICYSYFALSSTQLVHR